MECFLKGYWASYSPDPREDAKSRTPNSGLQYSSGVDYGTLGWLYFLDPPRGSGKSVLIMAQTSASTLSLDHGHEEDHGHVSHGQNSVYEAWLPSDKGPISSLYSPLVRRFDHFSCELRVEWHTFYLFLHSGLQLYYR